VAKISDFNWCCDESVLLKKRLSMGVGDHVGST
jgi:hypothetical protein